MSEAVSNIPQVPVSPDIGTSAQNLETLTPGQLAWIRFKRHKLALVSGVFLIVMNLITGLAEFFAPYTTTTRNVSAINAPPSDIRFLDMEGNFHLPPFVYGYDLHINEQTWAREYSENPELKYPIRFFARGEEYEFWNLVDGNLHFFVAENEAGEGYVHLLGTDQLGRDIYSRVLYGGRVSLSIGMLGIALTLVLGIFFGGFAGYLGGAVDSVIQRVIEVLQSLPTLPLWMALTAALPARWSSLRVYFGVSIILSLFGWTALARQVRGRFLALRDDDFIIAARLIGGSDRRVIFKHMMPNFMSHTITTATLAVPGVILGETALSFLGIGIRPADRELGSLARTSTELSSHRDDTVDSLSGTVRGSRCDGVQPFRRRSA